MRPLRLAVCTVLSACAAPSPSTNGVFSPEEQRAVSALLERQRGWRLADDRDNADADGLARQRAREVGYHPYRRRGDWNRDGHQDLAVVLVRDTTFIAFWIAGRPSDYAPAEEVGATSELRIGGLFGSEQELMIGPFESDAIWVFRWNAATRRLELVPENEG